MTSTHDLSGSGLGILGKQAKPRFKPVARRRNFNGVSKSKKNGSFCLKALETLSLDDIGTQIASRVVADDAHKPATKHSTAPKGNEDLCLDASDAMDLDDASNQIALQRAAEDKADRTSTKSRHSEFRLMKALPKHGLRFSDKAFKLQVFLGRSWKDLKVVRAMYTDMPRGQKPHKRYVQPLLVATYQEATKMVREGCLVPIDSVDAAETTYHTWREFFKKLVCRVQLNWPTELALRLFIQFFSALVDARFIAKNLAISEVLGVEEVRVELANLGVDSSLRKPCESIDIQKLTQEALKNMDRHAQPSELVNTIDGFLDAIDTAGAAWADFQEEDEWDID
ncbi:hypothetical protein N0V82_009388 [Gnomoniopsis sp. IMI 355080]|nr:hypothetical protein N0V82_009388 [Gnomoniopsis sp. IMI 355080]